MKIDFERRFALSPDGFRHFCPSNGTRSCIFTTLFDSFDSTFLHPRPPMVSILSHVVYARWGFDPDVALP